VGVWEIGWLKSFGEIHLEHCSNTNGTGRAGLANLEGLEDFQVLGGTGGLPGSCYPVGLELRDAELRCLDLVIPGSAGVMSPAAPRSATRAGPPRSLAIRSSFTRSESGTVRMRTRFRHGPLSRTCNENSRETRVRSLADGQSILVLQRWAVMLRGVAA
jgi:hypothetical protein